MGRLGLAKSRVPLPASFPLFASGLAGLGWLSRRRRKQAFAHRSQFLARHIGGADM
jgi:hypothetical protein